MEDNVFYCDKRTEALSVSAVSMTAVASAVQLDPGERKAGTCAVRSALVHRYSGSHLSDQVVDVMTVWISVGPAAQRYVRSAAHLAHCTRHETFSLQITSVRKAR